jgi:predicted  nucleic acid-binding Zn-ribbon protein
MGGFMQGPQTLNLGSTPGRVNPPPKTEGESTPTRDLLDETRSYINKTWTRMDEQQLEHEAHLRRTKALSVIVIVVVLLFAAGAWFTYPALRDQRKALAGTLGLQSVAKTLGERMGSAEARLSKVTAGLPALADRMAQLESNMKTNLQTARTQAQTAANQIGQRIRDDVNQSIKAIQSRMSGLESNQKESSERVNQLQEQVASLQKELTTMRDEASAANVRIKELNEAQQSSSRDLSGLNERVVSSQTALNTLANRVDRKRIDFDASNREAKQIAPDVYLTLRRTDAGKQEVDASLKVGTDGSTLPIRGQGIRKPVLFYGSEEARPMELVFTQVSKNRVSGYILLPIPQAAASQQ